MALADLILVIGLTPRGGTHILYSGTDAAAAAVCLSKVGPEFSEAILLPNPVGTVTRQPALEVGQRHQAARESRTRQAQAQAERLARFKADSFNRREAAKAALAERRAGGPTPAAPPANSDEARGGT